MEIVTAEPEPAVETADAQAPEPAEPVDLTETILGLKKGSVERALFEVRQKKMIDELRNGAPISGFFMPISGEYGN
jgi:hypothetical protein